MAELPGDIIHDILLRLPVKSLVRFECVSKPWCELIQSKYFVKRHLNNSILTKTNHNLLLTNRRAPCNLHFLGLYSLDRTLQEIVFPLKPNYPVIRSLVGSCNGLLCLYYKKLHGRGSRHFIIWNPFTRKHVKLPNLASETDDDRRDIAYGFGYDSVCDDYKVVILVLSLVEEFSSRAEGYVYSLRSGSWENTLGFPSNRFKYENRCGWLACGVLHWFVKTREENSQSDSYSIVAFDLVTEEQKIITPPDFPADDVSVFSVSELGGCFSIMSHHHTVNEFCVWVMKDYGITESWTLLFTISRNVMPNHRKYHFMIPLAYSENSDQVLMMLNHKEFFWYNLENKTVKFVEVLGPQNYFHPMICLESLVSLGEQAENDEKQGGEKRSINEIGKKGLTSYLRLFKKARG